MFKRLYIDNYKCLVNFELPLQQLSLLLGPNGVGKTSVLDVIFALRQLLGGVAKVTDPGIFPTPSLTRWQTRNVQVVEVDVEIERDPMTYRLEIEHERKLQRGKVKKERLTSNGKPLFEFIDGEVRLYRDDHSPGPVFPADWSVSDLARVPPRNDNTRLTRFLDFMRKVIVCGLYPASFTTESSRRDPVLLRNAGNFASWYQHLILERQDLVPEFTKQLQEVIQGLKAINLPAVGQDTVAMHIVFEQAEHRYQLRLDEISDGQRALIALYALVRLAAGQGYTLFLDEPDNYVALREIQPWLFQLEDACGDTVPQAVLCSHHPELIDYLGADRGVLLVRESSGVIKPAKVEQAPIEGGLKLSELVARGWEQ